MVGSIQTPVRTETRIPTFARADLPGLLEIASGTDYATLVRDAREFGPWAEPSKLPVQRNGHVIVYHHTASGRPTGRRWKHVRQWLDFGFRTWPLGVPYNFIVLPWGGFPIYYLHDVALAWPHTLNYNRACAIAAVGNFSVEPVPVGMPERMMHLADALASMWGMRVPEIQHRDVSATECPGNALAPLLPATARQRD